MTNRYKKPTIHKITVVAVYPEGMSAEEYNQALWRAHARYVAELLLRHFPELRRVRYREAA